MQSSPLIASLAILKVNFDSGHDYIDNFIPFLLECLRTAESPEASELPLQLAISEQFGLNVPLGAINIMLRRCYQRGYLKRVDHTLLLNREKVDDLHFSEIKSLVIDQHQRLIKLLCQFVEKRFPSKWNESDAEAALAAYLRDYGPPVLGRSFGYNASSANTYEEQIESTYVLSAFARHLHKRKHPEFDYLVTLVKGSMLASAIYFPTLSEANHRFKNLEVFLDTPLLIPALGLANDSLQRAAKELIEVTCLAGAQLCCFDVTAEELRRVLDFLSSHLYAERVSRGYHDALEYARRKSVNRSDIEFIIARLDSLLSNLQIRIVPTPRHTVETSVDEVRFEEVLQERLGYKRRSSLQHDLSALTAIHRLRDGQSAESLDNCRAVFVTDNLPLVRTSAALFKDYFEHSTVPHCISSHLLTTIAWLKNPLKAPDLPAHKLIADCYAALNPVNKLWDLYLSEMKRLQEDGRLAEGDYHLLRYSMTARNALMDITLGDIKSFTEGTVEEILRRSRAAIKSEVEQERLVEAERRLAAEEETQRAKERISKLQLEQRLRFEGWGMQLGRLFSRTAMLSGCLLLALAIYLSFPAPRPEVPSSWRIVATVLIAGCLLILGIMTIANLGFGLTVRGLSSKLEKSIATCVAKWLLQIFGIQENGAERRSE